MPMIWVEPEVAASYHNQEIYHVYKDNNRMQFWFTTDINQDDQEGDYDGPDYRFDVREISVPERISRLVPAQQVRWIMEMRPEVLNWPYDDPNQEGNSKWGYDR